MKKMINCLKKLLLLVVVLSGAVAEMLLSLPWVPLSHLFPTGPGRSKLTGRFILNMKICSTSK